MRIGVDIDNVLSKFNEALLENYLKHDKELRGTGIVNKDVYIKYMFDWSKEENEYYYKNNIERIAKSLEPVDDSIKYLKKLKDEGNEIYIISGRNNGEYSNPYQMTIDWLKKYDISYDKLILTNAYKHEEKVTECKKYDIDLMIDDSVTVCELCNKENIDSIIFDTEYNKFKSKAKRLHGWKEVYNYINNKYNIILDTDTYNECDDQFALSYLIKSKNLFNIEAITIAPYSHNGKVSVKEGQELSYSEAIKICKHLSFNHNKVFKGSTDYIQNGYNNNNSAVDNIIRISLKNKKTYILAIGAITNIALAVTKEPKIIDKIEVLWLGGNEIGFSNNLEYNFKQDIEAVKTIFNSKVKLTIFPCKNVVSKLKIDIKTLKNNIGNKSELYNYLIDRFYNDGYHGIQEERVIWDISVIAYMINENWFKKEVISCPNIKEDTSYELTNDKHKINIITDIDRDKIYEDLFKKLGDLNEIKQ